MKQFLMKDKHDVAQKQQRFYYATVNHFWFILSWSHEEEVVLFYYTKKSIFGVFPFFL